MYSSSNRTVLKPSCVTTFLCLNPVSRVAYDRKLKINHFVSEPMLERVELEWRPPVLFIVAKLKIGRYRIKVPILMFDMAVE